MTTIITQIFSVATIALQVLVLFLLAAWVLKKTDNPVSRFFSEKAQIAIFATTLAAMLGSLFYSLVVGYEPCELCWYQRIVMYPQAIILAVALWRKEKILPYIFVLSLIGVAIAGYHYLLQIGAVDVSSCAAVGYSSACAQRFVMTFGYITLPMMAFSVFAFNAVVAWLGLKK